MWRERVSTVAMAGLVCVAVVGLALAARTSMNFKRLSGDFRQEVSERFDLEAKIVGMEKQQAVAADEIKGLSKKLKDSEAALDRMKASLEKEREEKKALAEEVEKLRSVQVAPAANKT